MLPDDIQLFALAGFNPPEHGNHIGSEAETNLPKAKRRHQGNGNGHTGDELEAVAGSS